MSDADQAADHFDLVVFPPSVSDAVLDALVVELNDLARATGLALTLRMGKLIIDNFYDGDVRGWRERGARDASFRKLAARCDLQVSASALYRCVASHELCERLGVSTWQHLGPSHLRVVFGLPDSAQRRLLESAEQNAWTVEELTERTRQIVQRPAGTARGRRRLPRFVKTMNRIAKLLEDPEESFGDLEKIEDLEVEDAHRLFDTVSEMKKQCDRVLAQLQGNFIGLE
jgi:hypothetical protein